MITGELTQALITSRAALCLEPSSEINYIHCAVGCRELQIYDLSLKYWQFVIKINDKSYQGYIEIIKILHRLKLQPNLIIAIVQAITLLPEIGEFYVWLRKIAFEMNFILLAKSAHRSLSYFIEDLSQYVVWSGRLSQTIGESEASIDHFKVGVAISPHEAAPYYDLSFSIFKYSQIDKGVIVLSHAQTLSKDFILESPHKQWLGEAGKGRILLLYCSEEMKRAAIQFLRYVPYASARGWKIILLVPQTIFTLCQALDHVEEVITYQDRLPSFDCSASFSDLPRIFRARNDTIPSSLPFVKLSDDKNRFWSETLSTLTQHQDPSAPKIGYLIQSDLEDESPYRHSILPELFKPIVNYHPYQFYPLHFEPSLSPLNLSSKLTDYLELTAFLNQLDLFITVESHAAILAASLGKPTWLLEPFDQHWQWMVEPTQPENMQKSPWYPSVRFYRQTIQGDWSHPLSLIQENLMDFKNSL
jgi:hypothetical protein